MLTEQDKKSFKQTIQSNQYEIYIASIEEMDAIFALRRLVRNHRCKQPGRK